MEGSPVRVASDLTVIVPTVGRQVLEKCLQSLAGGKVVPARVVVVDQSECPAVSLWLRHLKAVGVDVVHLISEERSPASARNRGVAEVKTRFVAAIDDDCAAAADWLEKMEVRLAQNPESIVTGRLEPSGDGIPPTLVTSTVPRTYRRPSVRIHSPLASANMGFAVQTARRIGPFDGSVSPAEDNDWAYRALRLGIPVLFAPELVVYHFHWRTKAELRATYRAYGWSQGAFYGKHLRQGDWSMAVRTAISLWRGVRGLFRGVVQKDSGLEAESVARLECLLPGVIAGLRGLPAAPGGDRRHAVGVGQR
jgi:GT2 family glycosyltransferase